jgi:thymidine kinase
MSRKDRNGFPRELLEKGKEEWEQYFTDYAAEHPALLRAFSGLLNIILDPGGKQLVFVIGPTGSGKTFLKKAMRAEIEDRFVVQQEANRGRIPVVSVEIPSKDEVRPSWRIIYERLLVEMEEPLVDKKVAYSNVVMQRDSNGQLTLAAKTTTSKLRYALEQALKHRRPYAVFLDEAQHLMDMAGLSFQDQMDCLKSIANMTGVLFVLFGTYEMFSLLDMSDQLMRRSTIIHLPRYGSRAGDKAVFRNTLNTFQINMPFHRESDLLSHCEFFHERTAGCVGFFYEWLLAAYKAALRDPVAETLTEKHIEETCPLSESRAARMNKNIARDEAILVKSIGGNETYFERFRRNKVKSGDDTIGDDAGKNPGKPKRSHQRPGKPSPRRDRIGPDTTGDASD